MRRILRKLAEKRRWMLFAHAQHISHDKYSYTMHVRATQELAALDTRWTTLSDSCQGTLARYVELYGTPDAAMTWAEVEAAPRHASALEALNWPAKSNLFNTFADPKGS
jgi:hypothetical protein